MNELQTPSINVKIIKAGKLTTARVDARDLHKALGVKTRFAAWIAERIKEYGFTEGKEFFPILGKTSGKGGRPSVEYSLLLSMAKELAMVERNEKGQEIRRYFIDLEERVKSGDVTLADEIADKATPEQQEWLARRVAGKAVRNQFARTLGSHGVNGKGFADCTNALYIPILGGTANEVRERRNLPEKANLRNGMSLEELTRTALAEIVATKNIKHYRHYGNDECACECNRAARRVAEVR